MADKKLATAVVDRLRLKYGHCEPAAERKALFLAHSSAPAPPPPRRRLVEPKVFPPPPTPPRPPSVEKLYSPRRQGEHRRSGSDPSTPLSALLLPPAAADPRPMESHVATAADTAPLDVAAPSALLPQRVSSAPAAAPSTASMEATAAWGKSPVRETTTPTESEPSSSRWGFGAKRRGHRRTGSAPTPLAPTAAKLPEPPVSVLLATHDELIQIMRAECVLPPCCPQPPTLSLSIPLSTPLPCVLSACCRQPSGAYPSPLSMPLACVVHSHDRRLRLRVPSAG